MATRVECWQIIRNLVSRNRTLRITDVMQALGVKKRGAQYHIQLMCLAGELVARHQRGKSSEYTAGPNFGKTSEEDIDQYEAKAGRDPDPADGNSDGDADDEPAEGTGAEPGDQENQDAATDPETDPQADEDDPTGIESTVENAGKTFGALIPYAASAFKSIRNLFSSDDKEKPDEPPPKRLRKQDRADDDRGPADAPPKRPPARGGRGGFTLVGESGPIQVNFHAPINVHYGGSPPGSAEALQAAQARLVAPAPEPEETKPPEVKDAFNWGVLFGITAFMGTVGLFYYRSLVAEQLRGFSRDVILYGGLALFAAALVGIWIMRRKLHGPKALSGGIVGGVLSLAFLLGFHFLGWDRAIATCFG